MSSWFEKIVASPSLSLVSWVGAFIGGVVAATFIFNGMSFGYAVFLFYGFLISVFPAGILFEKTNIRFLTIAILLFLMGGARYLSGTDDSIDLLSFLPALQSLKNGLVRTVEQMLPEPHAGFLAGLLVGSGVKSPEIKAAFVATGTAHVMALSGWNISIITKWLDKLLIILLFKKKVRWVVIITLVIIFVIATGASASLVRAAVMAVLVTCAAAGGRGSSPGRAVLFAAGIMLLVSPRIIKTDIGFLLSISATLGMIYLTPFFTPFTNLLPSRFKISETVAGTIGATLATLPIILVAFGQTSLIALFANIFLLPFVAPTMLVGFIAALVVALYPSFAGVCGFVVQIFTTYDISVVRLFSRVPGASIYGIDFNYIAAIIMVLSMIYVVIRNHEYIVKKTN